MRFAVKETTLGWIGALASEQGLRRIILPLPSREQVLEDLGVQEGAQDDQVEVWLGRLQRCLEGECLELEEAWDEDLGTPFQRAVWRAIQEIPWGQTRSYGEIARAIGRPGAARAVGQALASNPLPILIPCHRVVGADGSLCGFACGQRMKRLLLALEGVQVREESA